jgi:hypothetical protein
MQYFPQILLVREPLRQRRLASLFLQLEREHHSNHYVVHYRTTDIHLFDGNVLVTVYFSSLLKVGRTPACVKTCNSQDTISATWRKERSTIETNEIIKPPHTGLSHDADVSFCLFCIMSWCLSWRSWCAAAPKEAFNIKIYTPIQIVPFSDNFILTCYKDVVICYWRHWSKLLVISLFSRSR